MRREVEGPVEGICTDVSTGGIGLRVWESLRIGETVRITVELPGRGAVDASAQVVRIAEGEVGLRFVKLSQRSLLAVVAHVSNQTN